MSKENKLEKRIAELELIVQQQHQKILDYEGVIKNTNQQLRSLLSEIQSDVARMKEIQKLIVPREIKKIQGVEFSSRFIPGQKIGGDYYDVFPIEDSQRFGIILSSAGSYGLSALVLSVLITIAPRLEAKANFDIQENVSKLVAQVLPQLKPTDQWSLFYGVFDKKYLELEYVLYGDIEVAVSHHGNATWSMLPNMSTHLRLNSVIEPKTQSVTLEPLSSLACVSPGLIARERELNLAQCLSSVQSRDVHELRNHIFLSCLRPKSGDFPDRDQTAVVMQVKDRAIRLAKLT